jgi:LmbE family N-acetylglucosaminyl deacetylase
MTSRTIVCFHAHPDDEALLMGGTMARFAAEGHRVVLVTATGGEAGLAASSITASDSLGEVRARELHRSAAILGCERVVQFGYPDSGLHGDAAPAGSFSQLGVEPAARRLAQLLEQEGADVLTGYDAAGGYGHPDHVQVHRVARRAAELARTPILLEATIDRLALQRALRLLGRLRPASADFAVARFDELYAHPSEITHRLDVGRYLRQKRGAMRAHASQSTADGAERGLAWMLRLPAPLFRLAFRREWFIETHSGGNGPASRGPWSGWSGQV